MVQDKIKKIISSFLVETEIESPFMKDLADKVILLTGGTGGVGRAIARVLVAKGATVVSFSRKGDESASKNFILLRVNVTKKKEIDNAIAKVVEKYGKIDVLINCAGIFSEKEFEMITEREYDRVMDTNVKSMFLMSEGVIPFMKKGKNGLIINIGSKISHNTSVAPHKVLYATSKYAVEGFSLSLSRELKKFGIRVTCLILGTMNTFVSVKSKQFLTPENVGFVITMLILLEDVDFESIIMKSDKQNI